MKSKGLHAKTITNYKSGWLFENTLVDQQNLTWSQEFCPEIQIEEMTEFETDEKSCLVQPDVKKQGITTYEKQSIRLEAVYCWSLMAAYGIYWYYRFQRSLMLSLNMKSVFTIGIKRISTANIGSVHSSCWLATPFHWSLSSIGVASENAVEIRCGYDKIIVRGNIEQTSMRKTPTCFHAATESWWWKVHELCKQVSKAECSLKLCSLCPTDAEWYNLRRVWLFGRTYDLWPMTYWIKCYTATLSSQLN